jgi:uncharacterized protein YutE (UPF0331/DUF86 family)
VLAENGALDEAFTKTLKEMAKFRNRLTHLYWEVDNEQVYTILHSRLNDFKEFLDSISAFLHLNSL